MNEVRPSELGFCGAILWTGAYFEKLSFGKSGVLNFKLRAFPRETLIN